MSINETLVKSMERTGLQRGCTNTLSDSFIEGIAKIEGFILNNSCEEANTLDRFVSRLIEIIVLCIIGFFLSIVALIFIETLFKTFFITFRYYNALEEIPYNQWLVALGFNVFLLAFYFQVSKHSVCSMTIIKMIIMSWQLMKEQKKKITIVMLKNILVTFIWWGLFYYGVFILTLQCIPITSISVIGYVMIGAFSFALTYILFVEVEKDEKNRIIRKCILLTVSLAMTIIISIIDLQKYNVTNIMWQLKLVSFILVVTFQLASIITIIKDLYKIIIKGICDGIEYSTDIYLAIDESTYKVEKDQMKAGLSYIYIFAPDNNSLTVTEYLRKMKEALNEYKQAYRSDKYRTIVRSVYAFMTLISMYSYLFILEKYSNKIKLLGCIGIMIITLFINYILFIICTSLIDKKSIFKVVVEDISIQKERLIRLDEEAVSADRVGLSELVYWVKSYMKKYITINVIVIVILIFTKILHIFSNINIFAFTMLIAWLSITVQAYLSKSEFGMIKYHFHSYTPKHFRYRMYKLAIRLSLVASLLVDMGLLLLYIKIL